MTIGAAMTGFERLFLRKSLILLLVAAACGLGCRKVDKPQEPVTIVFSTLTFSPALSRGSLDILADFTRETGIAVKLLPFTNDDMGARRYQHLSWLGQHASTPDVYQSDIIDIGTLAEHMLDLNPHLQEEDRQHIPAITRNFVFQGRLMALPLMTDIGLLFYRTDLLKKYGYARPPGTWDELEAMATKIQAGERAAGDKGFWGYVWEGSVSSEGLTYTALEWQASAGGGQIIEPDGTISVNNPRTIEALRRARKWVGTISPPGVAAYQVEDISNAWRAGRAAFMRNWPYYVSVGQVADSLSRGKFEVAPLPSGSIGRAGALGGWQISVSKYSTHKKEAISLVRYLTSARNQLRLSREFGYMPTRIAAYRDPELLRLNPHLGWLMREFSSLVVARPSSVTGANYLTVSESYKLAVNSVLTGQDNASDAMAKLERRLVAITGLPVRRPVAPLAFSRSPSSARDGDQ